MRDFEVTWAQNGADGLRRFNQEAFNLCVLDIMMPAIDGFTLAELIRNRNTEVPIIFLTAKSLTEDVIKGFKIGADDYIKKPVSEEELVARIQAVFRRSKISEVEESEALFEIGKYHFDSKNQQLTVDGNTRQLTEREAELLKMLCQNKGTLVSRKYVLQKLWGKTDYFTRKSMDVFISRLRKYLAADDSIKIMNVHGSGFVLSDN
jgi:DNA-binding response OmpR family regulator